jgi:acetaldehyde dehydrogenase (acetylating)
VAGFDNEKAVALRLRSPRLRSGQAGRAGCKKPVRYDSLTLLDRDLISIQEARQALARAAEAQKKFAAFSQNEVDAVVEACAEAATAAGEQLARTAVEETGYGNVPDKIIKNRLASVDVPRAIRGMKTVGILREDREKGIIEIAEPVGVVAAVIPSTNPTSTTIYKTLISLKARNAVILSPHPTAMRCICETAGVLERAALKIGAPEGLIICLAHPTMQGTQELMKSRETGVILATGGTGLVRAAYSSGRPAFGVGPGNVPSFIERTANVRKAVADIFAGKTFDYGTICSSEQSIVADEAVREQVLDECLQQGAYFLAPDEIRRLGEIVFPGGSTTPSPKIVGRAATVIAEMAGLKVPASTRVLIAKLDGVGREVPLSGEKLSPILAFYSAANLGAGIEICTKLLQYGGLGHTASIHSQNEAAVKQFGLAIPAFRIVVNTSAVHGSIGYSTNLFPAMTLGCGSHGGNITSDNIGPQHLMNIKRVAWESRPVEHRTIPADQRLSGSSLGIRSSGSDVKAPVDVKTPIREVASAPEVPTPASATDAVPTSTAVVPDRQTIARIVEQVFAARGISRGGTPKPENPAPSPAPFEAAAAAAPAPAPVPAPAKAEEPRPPVLASSAAAPAPPKIEVAEFVCEDDARSALAHNQKIFLGPKTIVTPSARDFGNSNDLFVVTDIIPTPTRKRHS